VLSGQMPDIDFNCATSEPFVEATRELIGEHSCYPLMAIEKLKEKAAWQLYAGVNDVKPETANQISKFIDKYNEKLKYADEEDKEFIVIEDFIPEEYIDIYKKSLEYQGITIGLKAHPCGHILFDGDIRREIGLIKCKSDSTKKEYITTVVDGYVAEEYKFVKNDLLKVDVANTIKKIYDSIGIEQHNILELTKIIENDKKTWDIYANGFTLGVNQMESNFGVQCCKEYKPKNVAEVTALVSALRPGFKSMLQGFLARQPYSTGVKALDDLLEDSFHYIMYQENIMTYLGWLGIEQTETYAIIKKISKKKFKDKELKELKERLSKAWINNTGTLDGFDESFHVVEDFSKYAFNASHAYAYAYDSLYGAYLKANYPYHFYSVMLQTYTEKGKKDKVTAYKKEMYQAFGIEEGKYKFRLDNRNFAIDEENHCINPSLASIKNMGKNAPQELYDMRNNEYKSFLDVLEALKPTSLNKTMIEILIKLDYFSEFGSPNYLLNIVDVFNKWNGRSTMKKKDIEELGYDIELFKQFGRETEKQFNDLDSSKMIQYFISKLEDKTSILDRLKYQHEACGYCFNKYSKHKNIGLVLDVDLTNAPLITVYLLDKGEEIKYKAYKRSYNKNIIKQYDMIQLGSTEEKPKTKKVGDDWVEIGGTVIWLNGWKKLN
jgi:DNA polymerase III alpha subunit